MSPQDVLFLSQINRILVARLTASEALKQSAFLGSNPKISFLKRRLPSAGKINNSYVIVFLSFFEEESRILSCCKELMLATRKHINCFGVFAKCGVFTAVLMKVSICFCFCVQGF
jgi:hypothetical protein